MDGPRTQCAPSPPSPAQKIFSLAKRRRLRLEAGVPWCTCGTYAWISSKMATFLLLLRPRMVGLCLLFLYPTYSRVLSFSIHLSLAWLIRKPI